MTDQLEFIEGQPPADTVEVPKASWTGVLWLITEDVDLSIPYQITVGVKLGFDDKHAAALNEALAEAGGIRGLLITGQGEAAQL